MAKKRTLNDIKEQLLSNALSIILPNSVAGNVADLKYNPEEGDNRGFARRGVSRAFDAMRSNFGIRRIASSMIPAPFKAMHGLYSDWKDAKNPGFSSKNDKTGNQPQAREITKSFDDTLDDIDDDTDDIPEISEGITEQIQLLEAMIESQDESIEILKHIDENTKRDKLKERELELESRKKSSINGIIDTSGDSTSKSGKLGGIGDALGGIVESLVQGYLGGKGIQTIGSIIKGKGASIAKTSKGFGSKVVDSIKTKAGDIFSKGSALAKTGAGLTLESGSNALKAGSSVVSKGSGILSSGLSKLGDLSSGIKTTASNGLNAIKGIGGSALKVLGTPLAIGLSALEAKEVHDNGELTDDGKNREYTKIGAKLAGMLAGAKAGALAGGALGTAAGTVVPGLGNVVGGVGGSLIGGIAGAFGGAKLGESAGDSLGKAVFKDKTAVATSTNPTPSKASVVGDFIMQNTSNLPSNISDYLNGKGNAKYDDIKVEYQKYLDTNGIQYDETSAMSGMALARVEMMKNKMVLEKLEGIVKSQDVNQKNFDIASLTSPNTTLKGIDSISVGDTRNNALSSLDSNIQRDHFSSTTTNNTTQPVIIQQASNSGGSISSNSDSNRTSSGVPNSRNQDGAIQRLLNNLYRPLLG